MVECDLHPAWAEAEYGPFFARSLFLLAPWHTKVMQQSCEWMDVKYQADELYGEDKERYLGLNFLIHGYRGVGEYLELVHKHRFGFNVLCLASYRPCEAASQWN